jgi:uncharacterized protein
MEITALALGFFGSLHCLVMCSPLAMAVTAKKNLSHKIIYNLGRIATYSAIGALFASTGHAISLIKLQNVISIIIGILLITAGVYGIQLLNKSVLSSGLGKVTTSLKSRFHKQIANKGLSSSFILGVLNGALPCGLSFAAFTITLTLQSAYDGFAFMTLFGLGTLPVMLGLTATLPRIIQQYHWDTTKVTAGLMIASGVLLIVRVFLPHMDDIHTVRQMADIILCR